MNDAQPTVILIGASASREAIVREELRDIAELHVEQNVLIGVSSTRKAGAQMALIDLDPDVVLGLRVMQDLNQAAPEVQLVALASAKDPELILKAVRAGAREFIVLDDRGELARVIGSLGRKVVSEVTDGQVICLFPAKGGLGATALATNLAGMLLTGGKRVVIVDLDLQLGDVLVFLDVASRYTIADVLHNMKRLDKDLLHASLARHSSGVHVLAQSDHLDEADKVTPGQIGPFLRFLARHFDYVVCDGLRGFDEMSLAALDVANKILLLIGQDVPSIKNGQRCLDVFNRLCYDADKVQLIITRYLKNEKIDLHAVEDNLGVRVAGAVSNDYQTMIRAINRGVLLTDAAPKEKVTDDIRRISFLVSGGQMETRRQGFLSGLFSRRRDDAKVIQELKQEAPAAPASPASNEQSGPKRTPEAI